MGVVVLEVVLLVAGECPTFGVLRDNRFVRVAEGFAKAEVREANVAGARNEDVVGLQISENRKVPGKFMKGLKRFLCSTSCWCVSCTYVKEILTKLST